MGNMMGTSWDHGRRFNHGMTAFAEASVLLKSMKRSTCYSRMIDYDCRFDASKTWLGHRLL